MIIWMSVLKLSTLPKSVLISIVSVQPDLFVSSDSPTDASLSVESTASDERTSMMIFHCADRPRIISGACLESPVGH